MATAMINPVSDTLEDTQQSTTKRQGFSRVQDPDCKVVISINELGVTQIARAAGLTRNFVSLVLNGSRKPSFDALLALSRACRCTPGQLIEYLKRQYSARSRN